VGGGKKKEKKGRGIGKLVPCWKPTCRRNYVKSGARKKDFHGGGSPSVNGKTVEEKKKRRGKTKFILFLFRNVLGVTLAFGKVTRGGPASCRYKKEARGRKKKGEKTKTPTN